MVTLDIPSSKRGSLEGLERFYQAHCRPLLVTGGTFAVALLLALSLQLSGHSLTQSSAAGGPPPRLAGGIEVACRQEFLQYLPSSWEQEWIRRAEEFQAQPSLVCETLKKQRAKSEAWLEVTTPREGFQQRFKTGQGVCPVCARVCERACWLAGSLAGAALLLQGSELPGAARAPPACCI